jgi:hypothetical protein
MSLRAGDAPAPPTFEEIKGDLKAIKQDGNDAAGQGTSLSKVALPGLRAAPDSSAAAPARPPAAADAAPNGRRRADSNWLLRGVELQSKPQPATRPKPGARSQPEAAGRDEVPLIDIDASDPAFMLQLYLAQPDARSAPEEARMRDEASDPAAQPGVGSFDTFLLQWVSKRDPALRGLIDAASPTPAGAVFSGPSAGRPSAEPEPASVTAPNPFLAAFELDRPGAAFGGIVSAAPSSAAPPPAVTPPPPAPEASAPAAPPPNPADDKKYFPQLNRF